MSPITKVFMMDARILDGGNQSPLLKALTSQRTPKTRLLPQLVTRCGRHNSADNLLIFRIAAQRIPIPIAFEPRLVFVSQKDRATQPPQRRLALAFERIRRGQPVRDVVIGVGSSEDFIGQLRSGFVAEAQRA